MTKIDIISGFLGAGKTTLIKKMLKEAWNNEQVVLIENEFGEIGIDGGFLKEAGIEIREMNSGCICCSLVGDFSEALKKVEEQYHPDRIVIEPSGVGKLSDVIKAVESVESDEMKLNSFVTVADAVKCKMYMKNFGEFFNNQIEYASVILLSRTDKMSEEKLYEVVKLIQQHNDKASIITTSWDKLNGTEILSVMESTCSMEAELMKEVHHHHGHEEECSCGHHHHDHEEECSCGHHHHDHEEECCCGHHHHDHEEECSCGHHHADEVFTSWGKETVRRYTEDELDDMLNALDESHDFGTVLRAKGIVESKAGEWFYFDYVPGEIEIRTGNPSFTGRLCVIGSKLNEEALIQLFGLKD